MTFSEIKVPEMKGPEIKTSGMKLGRLYFTLALSLLCGLAQASTGRDNSLHFGTEGWDLSLGGGVEATDGAFYLGDESSDQNLALLGGATFIRGRFYFTAGENEALLLGYTLVRDNDSAVDVVTGPKFAATFDDNSQLRGQIEDRNLDWHAGTRYTWYGDYNQASISITKDISSAHDGFTANADYQHEWQLKNWLLTGRSSLSYVSNKMANHIAGVSASESNAKIPAYRSGSANIVMLELKLEYPLTEHWIFQSNVSVTKFDGGIRRSPIIKDTTLSGASVGVRYQF